MRPDPVASFRVMCPACRREIRVAVVVRGIETVGLSLVDVQLGAVVRHDDCPER